MLKWFVAYAKNERSSFALVAIAAKLFDYFRGRIVAKLLGLPDSYIGYGSKVIGTKAITFKGNVHINRYAWIEAVHNFLDQTFTPSIVIGLNFAAADRLHISCINKIQIADNCLFGSGVYIADHNHGAYKGLNQSSPSESPVNRRLASFGAVDIGSNVWLGDNVVIVGSVKIGSGAVVGANSVVTKDIPSNVIVVGNPIKLLKKFNNSTGAWEII